MNRKKAFTLNELLIVIAIIVLLIGLALPAFNALSGSGSVESAQNQVSAFLGQARVEAIGVQEPRGVLFFLDPETDRVNMAITRAVYTEPVNGTIYFDLVTDRDFVALPNGVGCQTIDSPSYQMSGNINDQYVGYNAAPASAALGSTGALYGGMIVFDGYGKLMSPGFGLHCSVNGISTNTTAVGPLTTLGSLLAVGSVNNAGTGTTARDFIVWTGDNPLLGGFGVVLFEREGYLNSVGGTTGRNEDYQIQQPPNSTGFNGTDEKTREDWIRSNATHLLINRYNGTLMKGE